MINYIFFNSYTICLYINELLKDMEQFIKMKFDNFHMYSLLIKFT